MATGEATSTVGVKTATGMRGSTKAAMHTTGRSCVLRSFRLARGPRLHRHVHFCCAGADDCVLGRANPRGSRKRLNARIASPQALVKLEPWPTLSEATVRSIRCLQTQCHAVVDYATLKASAVCTIDGSLVEKHKLMA